MKNIKYIAGVDVGGTTIKLGLFTKERKLIDKWTIDTDKSEHAKNLFSDIEISIKDKINKLELEINNLLGVGIGLPGPVIKERFVTGCVNIGLPYTDVISKFSFKKSVSIKVQNDARLATLGEFHHGAGKGLDSIMLLTLGTGIGSGCVIEGGLLSGFDGSAGEIGHIKVPKIFLEELADDTFIDLEHIASGISIEKIGNEFLKLDSYRDSKLQKIGATAKNIFENAKLGDELAIKLANIMCRYLGLGISYAAAVVNPEAIIFGGGVSRAGDILINKIEHFFKKYAFEALKNCKILKATLENDAGIFGAAALVSEAIDEAI